MNPDTQNKRRQRIIHFANQKFLTEGYSNVTMDEIAYGLGMGKGTLYKYFESKEDLMISVVDEIAQSLRERVMRLLKDEQIGSASKLQGFLKIVGMQLASVPLYVMSDIMRNAPSAYERIDEMRRQMIEQVLTTLLKDGIKGGVFRPEANATLIVQMAIGSINQLSSNQAVLNSDLSLESLFHTVINTLLCGCLTDKGRNDLNKTNDPAKV